jgi:hypothetical protein
MDFVFARIQIVEQPLRVKRAGGTGDGNENFHCAHNAAGSSRKQVAEKILLVLVVILVLVSEKLTMRMIAFCPKQLESAFAFRKIGACSNRL